MSIDQLPNLPGIKRDPSAGNMRLYREFKAFQQSTMDPSLLEEQQQQQRLLATPSVEVENSLVSYFENAERLKEYSKSLSPFPNAGAAYNDIHGRYSLKSQQADRLTRSRSLPYCSLDSAPSFVCNDSRVCRFLAYFTEEAPENLTTPIRSRQVEIVFYLADDTVEISEPRVQNSGLSQGKVLRRHQVPKPGPGKERASTPSPLSTGERGKVPVFTIADVYAGAELNIYNRIYTVIDCDQATRKYLESVNRPFGDKLPLSANYWDPAKRPGNLRPQKKHSKGIKNLGFYEHERKVLRFFGIWDSREILFGDEIRVRVHYSLADNRIEVLPIHSRNSGRDKLAKLLKKTTIMKKADPGFEFPESYSRATTAAGLSRDGMSSRSGSKAEGGGGFDGGASSTQFGGSASQMVLEPARPYHWTDLRIGEQIAVASLSILILDADEFTREFYVSKNRPLDPPISMPLPIYPTITNEIPPYNPLFGSEEDSLQTCKGSLAGGKPAMKDGAKAKLFQGMILRFLATLLNPKPADESRKFIIQVHLEDDTVQIREPPQRNSGHKGGIFLARGKVMMDAVLGVTDGATRGFQPQDVHVGGTIKILSHKFVVHDADEYTFKYMEENPKQFHYSDLTVVRSALQQRQEVISRLILTQPGLATRTVAYDECELLFKRAGLGLVKQQVVTLLRVLDPKKLGNIKMTKILKYILGEAA